MSRDHFNLDGRVALVAGASRGIGEAIAKRLAEYGATVLVTSRKVESCQAVADAIIAIIGIILMYGLAAAVGVEISSAFLGIGPQNLVGAAVAIYMLHQYL
jgi:NAD(P)-dependent dehydrogenase (short-subunit alcohol dehydrogenase family)